MAYREADHPRRRGQWVDKNSGRIPKPRSGTKQVMPDAKDNRFGIMAEVYEDTPDGSVRSSYWFRDERNGKPVWSESDEYGSVKNEHTVRDRLPEKATSVKQVEPMVHKNMRGACSICSTRTFTSIEGANHNARFPHDEFGGDEKEFKRVLDAHGWEADVLRWQPDEEGNGGCWLGTVHHKGSSINEMAEGQPLENALGDTGARYIDRKFRSFKTLKQSDERSRALCAQAILDKCPEAVDAQWRYSEPNKNTGPISAKITRMQARGWTAEFWQVRHGINNEHPACIKLYNPAGYREALYFTPKEFS